MPFAGLSFSGAVLMGLLAVRNSGIEVPGETIDRAIKYYVSMTSGNGQVGYSGGAGGGSLATSSIGVVVYSIGRRQDLPQYVAASKYIAIPTSAPGGRMDGYSGYYRAQALFQCDVAAREKWNAGLVKRLKAMQAEDGIISGGRGNSPGTVTTSLYLLSLAVNCKFLPVYER